MANFAERLRELRTEKGLSYRALADEIGTANSTIVFWENGKCDIKSVYIIRLAKFFNVSTDYLLGLTE